MADSSNSSGTFPTSTPDWNNLAVLHRNTLPPRAYFFPYSSSEKALTRDISESDAVLLSGTWKFNHVFNPYDAPEGFEAPEYEVDSWSDIQVPGFWQLQNFSKPVYTNTNYHFPIIPPHVPVEGNETGCYVRSFLVPAKLNGMRLRLRFEGVDAAFHVWVNGREVGYSQGSRNASEFDITDLVRDGGQENRLAVKVYRFCDGSYIEDQDQWRTSGIFRDVWLVGFGETSIEDLRVQTDLDAEYRDAEIKVDLTLAGKGELKVRLLDHTQQKTLEEKVLDAEGATTVAFKLANPLKWSAETPNLYHLLATYGTQSITQQIGIRKTEIKDGLFLVNGRRIVFRGANRHEHHPIHGRSVPYEFMKQDLLLMKQHNLNAIRTSHQPSDPRLYELANELGLWVMDEADLECHGFTSPAENAMPPSERWKPYEERKEQAHREAAKWTSEDPTWEEAYVDRAKQLVKRDINQPSVIMWSLGNEAFYGRNFQAMYDWMRQADPTRFVHYEGDVDARTVDVYSRMYPSVEEIIEQFGKAKDFDKPLVLCEFIHAMGTGPGNIKEYIDAFYAYPRLQGGFVWEWANHGMLTKNEEGEEYYGYGGDFGEDVHDYNFVMDGVVFSDHRPGPGLLEYAKAIEPVQLVESATLDPSTVEVVNRYDITTLDHLKALARYCVKEDSVEAGEVQIPAGVEPGKTAKLDLKKAVDAAPKDAFAIEVSFIHKEQPSWVETQDHRVAWFQIALPNKPIFEPTLSRTVAGKPIAIERSVNTLTISAGENQTYVFALTSGTLTAITRNGKNLLMTPPTLTISRPLTDNDRPQDGWVWVDKRVHQMRSRFGSIRWSSTPTQAIVSVTSRLAPPVLAWGFEVTTTYTIATLSASSSDPTTGLKIRVQAKPYGEYPPDTLPRIGLSFSLPSSFETASWFGRGPGQSYRDMKLAQPFGYYTLPITDLWVPYEFPQECANRTDVSCVDFSSSSEGADPTLRAVFAGGPGNFTASHYKDADIEACTHPFELEKRRTEEVQVRLDWAHHGLGTGSCGPKTRDEYALKYGAFDYEVWLL